MKKGLLYILALFCFTSCMNQKITYNLDRVQVVPAAQRLNQITFSVQNFEDIRSTSEQNETHLNAQKMMTKINKTDNCINAEKFYDKRVNEQMTSLFANHLITKGVFVKV